MEGDTHQIDEKLLLVFRSPQDSQLPLGPGWFQEMMRDISALGSTITLWLCTLLTGFYFIMIKKGHRALYLIGAVATGTVLSNLLKLGFDRPRPDLVPHGSLTYTASFPSGHSMMAAIVYLSIGALLAQAQSGRNLKIYFMSISLLLTILIGISRVYLGVHWPSDVLAGWLAGAICAMSFWFIEWSLKKNKSAQITKSDDPA